MSASIAPVVLVAGQTVGDAEEDILVRVGRPRRDRVDGGRVMEMPERAAQGRDDAGVLFVRGQIK